MEELERKKAELKEANELMVLVLNRPNYNGLDSRVYDCLMEEIRKLEGEIRELKREACRQ